MRISDWSSDVCSSDLRLVDPAQDQRQRIGAVGELGEVQRPHRGHPDQDVDRDARDHRSDDPDREIAPRVLGLLSRGRDRIEPVEGEEDDRSEEHTSELQSLMRISYAVFCLKKKTNTHESEDEQQYMVRTRI